MEYKPGAFFSRTAVAALVSAAAGTLWSVLQLLTLFEHEQLPRLGADALCLKLQDEAETMSKRLKASN